LAPLAIFFVNDKLTFICVYLRILVKQTAEIFRLILLDHNLKFGST